jgi:hypothetical protein
MSERETREAGDNCNAHKTDGSGYCGQPAGWGTDHAGYGRCKLHGGNTPAQEKNLLDELSSGAEDAAVVLRLRLKHIREKVEAGDGDAVNWSEVDRLARTVFDRTGHGKTETRELTGEGDDEISVSSEVVTVTSDDVDPD